MWKEKLDYPAVACRTTVNTKLDMTGSGSRLYKELPCFIPQISIKKIDIELSNPQGTVMLLEGVMSGFIPSFHSIENTV